MEHYQGKVALVTGASAGIGAAIAISLARAGLKVVGLARRVGRVDALQKELKNAKGQLFPLEGDISKVEDVERVFEWVKQKFGTIHVLINNAGIGRNGGISDGKLQDFVQVINTNLTGLLACTQKALQLMESSGVTDGHIININSVAGHSIPNIELPLNIYPATKYGVTALTETLRLELARKNSKIRVTSISPGVVATEIGQAMAEASGLKPEDLNTEFYKNFEHMPKLQSEDVADVVMYVLGTPARVQIHEVIMRPTGEIF